MTRVLKGKYSPASSSFLEAATVKPNISYTWRSILAAKDLLKGLGLGLQRNTRRVWADPWVPNFRVMQSRNHPPADQSIFHASDLIIISNGEWNLAKLRTHFIDWQVSTSEADSWSWGLSNNGFYSVKTLMSAYYLALQGVNSAAVGEQNSKVNNAAAPNIRRSKFLQVYQVLKSQLLNDPAFEWTSASRQWVQEMLEYNVPRGKLNRGLSVIDSYRLLKDGKELTDDEFFLASALGWCIEWLQAYFLVLDDIMDSSHTRRGQPCWFRVPKVGMIAVNDGIILRNHIPRILKNHFRNKKYYVDLLDLFDEVEFQSASGQMIDLITTIEGEKDLSNYSLDLHRRIVQYKTAYNSFYLSVACALLISGEKLEDHVDVKNILIDMGIYFQVQDDYLDCYGDPEFIGKIGTDIENFKCSWLVVKALELCNDEQKKVLYENYGKDDPACVARVKELYNVLNMQGAFADYESKSYDKLIDSIETHPSTAVQAVLKSFLAKIYKRQK